LTEHALSARPASEGQRLAATVCKVQVRPRRYIGEAEIEASDEQL
jgi:hypothetical protein